MCGGHGIHHILGLVASDITQAQDAQYHLETRSNSSTITEQQVKLMYARGEIGAEAFRRLLDMAQAGNLRADELTAFQSQSANARAGLHDDRRQQRGSSSAHLRQLQQRRHELEAACAETEESIRRLQLEAAQLYQDAASVEIDIERAAPDAGKINTLLEFEESTLSRAHSVEERIERITESLAHMRMQLGELVTQEEVVSQQS